MSDLISRQALCEYALNQKDKSVTPNDIMRFPSAQASCRQVSWIPCTDRLPDTNRRVLCLTKTKKGIINYVIGYYADDRWCCGMNSNVVAWMELPAPPEEETL